MHALDRLYKCSLSLCYSSCVYTYAQRTPWSQLLLRMEYMQGVENGKLWESLLTLVGIAVARERSPRS